MKILVTGSRTWNNAVFIEAILCDRIWFTNSNPILIMHGDCPDGADALTEFIASKYEGWKTLRFPADWPQYGKRAGYIRNSHMVDQDPDVCLAFIRDGSKGATMTAELCKKRGVETWVYAWDSEKNVIHAEVFNQREV